MNEIFCYGMIDNYTAQELILALKDKSETLLRINSVGGDVCTAFAIYNLLKEHGNVNVQIDGLCASAATIVMCGGKKIIMAKNALLMIHLPVSFLAGKFNSEELNHEVETLQKINSIMTETYQSRTGKTEEEILQMMKDETWFTAEQAKEKNFVDEILNQEVTNLFKTPTKENLLDKFVAKLASKLKIPEQKNQLPPPKPETPQVNEMEIASKYFAKLIEDNMTSGAENILASDKSKTTRRAQAEMIAKFAKK